MSRETRKHQEEVRERKRQTEKERKEKRVTESRNEGLNIWREKFRQMAEKNREVPIVIKGVEKHIARIERGRG